MSEIKMRLHRRRRACNVQAVALRVGFLWPAILFGCSSESATPPVSRTGGASGTGGVNGSGGSNGSGGGNGSGGSGAVACPDAPMRLAVGCSGGQCHGPEFASEINDIVTVEGLASRLINVDKKSMEDCNGQTKLVNPTRPASGVLFERLTTTTCGARQMPPADAKASQQLSDTQRAELVACLKAWLEPQLQ